MSQYDTQVVIGRPVVEASGVHSAAPLPERLLAPMERRNTMMSILAERGWPPGLTDACVRSIEAFPVRFVVVDNSGSMNRMDGTRLVTMPNGTIKSIKATRWAELGDVVMDFAEAVGALRAESHLHLLNPSSAGQFFVVGANGDSVTGCVGAPADANAIKSAMATSPTGSTPLTEAVQLIISLIAPAADKLRAQGQQAVVVLATDGLPNEPPTFLRALQELQRLPVWLVVRLCTDESEVVDYWSELDAQLEMPLETLDDVRGEAEEVRKTNPWLTYAPSLHLARTMGLQDKLFDLLDERALLPTQCKQLIERLLGCAELLEPEIDTPAFIKQVSEALAQLPNVYDPVSCRMVPWINTSALLKHCRGGRRGSGSGGCVIA